MRYLLTGLISLFLLSFYSSCKKEMSLEFGSPAKGSLQGAGGDCLPKTVSGTYRAGKVLNDSNFIEVSVAVAAPGPYTITTDSVNGYAFKATGTFTTTGANTVRLKGNGMPVSAGVNSFRVVFDTTSCDIAITVLPSNTPAGPGVFTLVTNGTGCADFALEGNYVKDSVLNSTNRVGIKVNVTTTGTYSISTNALNGYSFSATGTFSTTGQQIIYLQGAGKPLAAQTDNFTVTAGTSSCGFSVTVVATAPPPPGPCGTTPEGTYTVGTALTASNKVVVNHNYSVAGPYNVTVTSVNGYSFGPASISAVAGSNSITLNGSGTPSAAGTNTFTINFGDGTSCTFTVTVVTATPPPANNDHFPLTANSWWSYDDSSTPGDSIKVTNVAAVTINSNAYRRFLYQDDSGPYDTSHFRRSADDYFEYRQADWYSPVPFENPQKVDILFLKENITTGTTWNSAVFSGTASGQAVNIRYVFTCADANATVTVNGKTFTNVYKINFKGQFSVGGAPYQDDGINWTAHYAKGVGLINLLGTAGANSYELKIKNWVVF